jgi:anti-sigma factor RsiW
MGRRDRHPGDLIADLVDGRLTGVERVRVAAHVAGCPECLSEYDAQVAAKGALGRLDAPGAPDDLRDRLVRVPAASTVPPVRPPRTPPSRQRRVATLGAGAVAASLAAVTLAYVAGGPSGGPAVVPPVDRYVREHAAVSGGVPLTEPALSQLAKGTVPGMPVALSTVSATVPSSGVSR